MARLENHSWDPWDAQSEQAGAGCEIQIVSVLMRPPPLHPYDQANVAATKRSWPPKLVQSGPSLVLVVRRYGCRVVPNRWLQEARLDKGMFYHENEKS